MAAKYVWTGKPLTRFNPEGEPEVIKTNEEFEPTLKEQMSFGDLMRPSDKERDASAPKLVTSTPNRYIGDVPQKGMLHTPPLEEDDTEPEGMPKQIFHRMPPAQQVVSEEGEGAEAGQVQRRGPGRPRREEREDANPNLP